jgi:myo-inositol-1(or 4)-monophosphatase
MHPFLNIANTAAREAGKLILKGYDRLAYLDIREKSPNDFVSEIDFASEQYLIQSIKSAYPDHGILAEESGCDDENAFYQWIIDPLDGTTNFIRGIPHFCISIAIKIEGKIEHGLIYDPIREEVYTASRGRGAQLNNKRLRVSRQQQLERAIVSTDIAFSATAENNPKLFNAVQARYANIRCTGSAALDLAYVAAGRLDAYWETGLNIWDIAAGALLVREAGGLVSDFVGGENYLNSGNIIAGTPKVYKELAQTLAPHIPDEWKK